MDIKEKVKACAKRVKEKVAGVSDGVKSVVEAFVDPQASVREIEGDQEVFAKEHIARDAEIALSHEKMKEAIRNRNAKDYN